VEFLVNKKQRLSLFILLLIIFINFVVYSCEKNNNGVDDIASYNSNIEQKLIEAEMRYDIEILQDRMPWLDIVSANWKTIILSDYLDGIPGPTDILSIGILTLDSDYLISIKSKYQWDDTSRIIPVSLLADDMKGYVLQTSQEYKNSYLSYKKGNKVSIFVDFNKEIVLFRY